MNPAQNKLQIDSALLRKFDVSGPRYTSYPTADRFVEAFDEITYRGWLAKRNVGGISHALSLYVHLPFCDTVCYYCGCNRIITANHGRSTKYVEYLSREIRLQSGQLRDRRRVRQMHWGGGTPTFLDETELSGLMRVLREHFEFDPGGENSIEVDPRKLGDEKVALLTDLGFNRISLGVQDFDSAVQLAVNRIQTVEETARVVAAARRHGFRSVNIDLIYGLPKQHPAGFARTLDQVITCAPERIALYSYAHLPALFKPQRRILDADLPAPEVKLELLMTGIQKLLAAGYVYIGMDHFALPADDLAVAQRQGRLYRSFQGYSTFGEADLIGMGVSAIGKIGPTYSQNVKTLDEYYDRIERGQLPVMRGIELTADDLLRRAVIQALSCHFEVSMEAFESAHLIDFRSYFRAELRELLAYAADGLVEVDGDWVTVTPKGRLLVRVLCMVFDKYLRQVTERARYSKVI